jgi:hypothetical protein
MELLFEVSQEADGGYCAECLTEHIFTQGDTWDDLRANVKEAVAAFYFDREGPDCRTVALGSRRDARAAMKLPRDLAGKHLASVLCRKWGYQEVHQAGSQVILDTGDPSPQRISIPSHTSLRLGTLSSDTEGLFPP